MATADEPQAIETEGQRSSRERQPLIRISREERERRRRGLAAALAEMAAIPNGPDEDDGDFLRALDESHPGRFDLTRYY